MTDQLPYTLDEVRTRELEYVGTRGRPNPWWGGPMTTSDCVGYQTDRLGLRRGGEDLAWLAAHDWLISIAAFRMHYQWPVVPADELIPGDLICENWTGTIVNGRLEAQHMEWLYSRNSDDLVIVAANTSRVPGNLDPSENGCWKKARTLNEHILFGIRPPYRPDRPSRARRNEVIAVARFLNARLPAGLYRTQAEDDGGEGPRYWLLVQTYARAHGWYPHQYVIDGIPGPQSRKAEAAIYQIARHAK